jgi:hypothetical protein
MPSVQHISRDADRSLGLYVISLTGAERHFSCWCETSVARRLADDVGAGPLALSRTKRSSSTPCRPTATGRLAVL